LIKIDNILEVWIHDLDEMLKGKFSLFYVQYKRTFMNSFQFLGKTDYHEPRNLPETRVHNWMEKPLPGPALSPLEPNTPDLDPGR
jgi:hypothetical protein